jgi:hypothetical protein
MQEHNIVTNHIMTTQCYKTILLFPIVEQISYSNFQNKIRNVKIHLQPKLAFAHVTDQIIELIYCIHVPSSCKVDVIK